MGHEEFSERWRVDKFRAKQKLRARMLRDSICEEDDFIG